MNIILKIYLIISSVIGTGTILFLLLGCVYLTVSYFKQKRDMKKQMDEFKEAIAKTGMGKDLNRPLTEDEKELLKATGHLEFTERLDMETLNVTKETKN